jgi:hypothetical protein
MIASRPFAESKGAKESAPRVFSWRPKAETLSSVEGAAEGMGHPVVS